MDIPHLLYEEDSFGIFVLVSILMGGGAAWLTGRAVAGTWRPWWQVVAYTLLLGGAVRFFHYALFGGTLVAPYYYVVDTTICMAAGFVSFRLTRVRQMITRYPWINERSGLFAWVRRPVTPPRASAASAAAGPVTNGRNSG